MMSWGRYSVCAMPRCAQPAASASRYCRRHRRNHIYRGHPEQAAIDDRDRKHCREIAGDFLEAHGLEEGLQAAHEEMADLFSFARHAASYLDAAGRQAGYKIRPAAAAGWGYLVNAVNRGLTAPEAIEIILAVWLLAHDRPRFLPPEAPRLTPIWGAELARSHGWPAKPVRSGKQAGRQRCEQGSAKALRVIGAAVWERFAPLLVSAKRRMEQDAAAAGARRVVMRDTFTETTQLDIQRRPTTCETNLPSTP